MKRKLYWAILASTAVIFVLLLATASRYTTQSSFCTRCHESKAQYLVWTVSSHSKVDCLSCHRRPGVFGFVEQNLRALTHGYLHLAGIKTETGSMSVQISDANCRQCHTIKRTVTPGGDLIIPHSEHVEQDLARCIDCHTDLVHAGRRGAEIARQVDDVGNLAEIQSALSDQLTAENFRPRMGTCMQCHDGEKAPYTCQSCHQDIETPASHGRVEWQSNHGVTARKNLAECVFCHALAAGKTVENQEIESLSLEQAVRFNDFCKNCHEKRPASHGEDWSFTHREKAEKDAEGCLACHSREQGGAFAGTIVSCNKCHDNDHGDQWLRKHPGIVREQGLVNCFSCHGKNNCSSCHLERAAQLIR